MSISVLLVEDDRDLIEELAAFLEAAGFEVTAAETIREAEALLAGIVLDTKGFTMRTGSRTFETAAFLRKSGADTAQVNKFFQNDLRDTVTKFHIIQGAHTYRGSIALALTDRLVGRAIAGQAADELLNTIKLVIK